MQCLPIEHGTVAEQCPLIVHSKAKIFLVCLLTVLTNMDLRHSTNILVPVDFCIFGIIITFS